MGKNSKIEWTHHTFNPWIGCTKVSPGCANCYAEALIDTRWGRVKWGKGQPRSRTGKDYWLEPLKWQKAAEKSGTRPRVFCASLADWLDDEVPAEWLFDLLTLIHKTPTLDWLLLTKRPEKWKERLAAAAAQCTIDPLDITDRIYAWLEGARLFRNVWIGTSAEDQTRWDERLPRLLAIPALIHFVSAEPLLGPIQMGRWHPDWIIVGGESGPKARPMHREWVESLRYECAEFDCSFFFKQWGGVNKHATGRELDGQTYDGIPQA